MIDAKLKDWVCTDTSIFTWCGGSSPPLAFEFDLKVLGFFSLRGRVRTLEGSILKACEQI